MRLLGFCVVPSLPTLSFQQATVAGKAIVIGSHYSLPCSALKFAWLIQFVHFVLKNHESILNTARFLYFYWLGRSEIKNIFKGLKKKEYGLAS